MCGIGTATRKEASMAEYKDLSKDEMKTLYAELKRQYDDYCALGLALNMARGKPSPAQLDLSMPMMECVSSARGYHAADGTDCRNYGVLAGIPEARALAASMVGARPEQTVVCGVSSLNIMFDTIARAWVFGFGGNEPWGAQESIKFICPCPGYDRHFAICEQFGIEMIPVELDEYGPDLSQVASLVEDPAVKGIWCVPQYANPSGITYSDEVVRGLAALEPAAADFRIFWDNAYAVHHLFDDPAEQDHVLNILDACTEAGHPDMVFEFCSTSKVTFPGAGIAAFVSSEKNVEEMLGVIGKQIIGNDKLTQLRHAHFISDEGGIAAHMSKHASLLRPRFEAVLDVLDEDLTGTGVGLWTRPRGGYFISFDGLDGTAKETVRLAEEAGVVMTGAGATWPYHDDPHDSNIRIAPSFPTVDELEKAARIFTVCVRMAALEKLMGE